MNPLLSTLIEGAWQGLAVAAFLMLILPWVDRHTRFRIVPISITAVLTARYLWWRITATLPPIDQTIDFIAGITFLAIEATTLVGVLLSLVTLSRVSNRSAEADANIPWLKSQTTKPLVDVSSAPTMRNVRSMSAPSSVRCR